MARSKGYGTIEKSVFRRSNAQTEGLVANNQGEGERAVLSGFRCAAAPPKRHTCIPIYAGRGSLDELIRSILENDTPLGPHGPAAYERLQTQLAQELQLQHELRSQREETARLQRELGRLQHENGEREWTESSHPRALAKAGFRFLCREPAAGAVADKVAGRLLYGDGRI